MVLGSYVTVAATDVVVPLLTSLKVVLVIVPARIASEKVAETFVPAGTPVAPAAGVTDLTVGAVMSSGAQSGSVSGEAFVVRVVVAEPSVEFMA